VACHWVALQKAGLRADLVQILSAHRVKSKTGDADEGMGFNPLVQRAPFVESAWPIRGQQPSKLSVTE
jgi:hypothetical protein